MKSSSIFAFLGGIAVGAVAALLLAPAKGDDTRRIVKEYLEREGRKLKGGLGMSCGCGCECGCECECDENGECDCDCGCECGGKEESQV